MKKILIRFGVLVAVLLAASAAQAQRAPVMLGDHGNYGRLVVELAAPLPATINQRGNRIDIAVPGTTEIVAPDSVPRNVLSFRGGHGTATVQVVPGARLKPAQSGRLIILDILDPRSRALGARSAVATRSNPGRPAPSLAAQNNPTRRSVADRPALPLEPDAKPAEAIPPQEVATAAPAPISPAPIPPSPPDPAPAPTPTASLLRLSAGPEVGAVALRRGDEALVVFDDRVDPDATDDEPDQSVAIQHQQGGTIVTFKLGSEDTLALSREGGDWVIRTGPVTATPAAQTVAPEGIAFQFTKPGRTMTISDPATGQLLLLGTLRQAGGAQSMIDARRAAPGYVLLPTWMGLALEVSSDTVDLRVSMNGFTLQIPDKTAPGNAIAAVPENAFQIPNGSDTILLRQLDAQIASAAAAPPRGRGRQRVAAARTMLALGLAPEAQALLTLAATDDPVVAADPQASALRGIAAVLAGRPQDALGLDNPNLPAQGDVAMWRGIRDSDQGKPAPLLAGAWPSLAAYPEAVRKRIRATVMEAAVAGGDTLPPSELEGPGLAFARALRIEKSGDIDGAIEAFAEIADGRDERDSVRATLVATELRLRQGKIKPADAADTIDHQIVRWRGDAREEAMRLRAAELRTQAGQWRAALDILRETGAVFPGTKDRVAAMIADVFKALLAAKDDTIKPLELVTIAGDFADRLPGGEDGERLAGLLAEKLAALDLPSRAIPVLQRLADQATAPKAKAEYTLRLAQLQLDAGDPAKVETILSAVDTDMLTPEQVEQRLLMLARARAGRDPAAAAATLSQLDDPAGAELRASLLAKAGDWPGSLKALQLAVSKTVPDSGELTEKQQDLVLREATAAVHAGDADALKLIKRFDSRLKGPRADLFKVLTASAVESPEDLPRAAQELAMTRSVPERLDALRLR